MQVWSHTASVAFVCTCVFTIFGSSSLNNCSMQYNKCNLLKILVFERVV